MGLFSLKKSALPELRTRTKPYVMAHRGNQVLCPENTPAAFTKAVTDGADIIETDLHLTKDNEFVCIHDPTVDRTTNGTGLVAEKTLSQIKSLNASNHFPHFSTEQIPTLKETISIIPQDMALALELKTDAFLDITTAQKLVHALMKENMIDRTLILSFSWARIKAVKSIAPSIHSGWITLSDKRPRKGPDVLGPYWRILINNPFYVFWAHLQNQAVCPLDSKPDLRLWLYKLLRCDAIITDDPGKTIQRLKKKR